MYPSDKRPRLYTSGAAKKREKKRRLDNAVAVAGTSKIRSFLTAPEDEAAAGPTTAEPARCGPVVRELSGRYTVRCNLAEFVIRGSSYKYSEPWALHE